MSTTPVLPGTSYPVNLPPLVTSAEVPENPVPPVTSEAPTLPKDSEEVHRPTTQELPLQASESSISSVQSQELSNNNNQPPLNSNNVQSGPPANNQPSSNSSQNPQNLQEHTQKEWALLERIAHAFGADIIRGDYEKSQANCFAAALEACQKKDWNLINSHNLDLSLIRDRWQRTLLMHAVMRHETEWVVNLIGAKIAINATDLEGNTAFHLAAKQGSSDLIEDLWLNLSIGSTNNTGKTPLHIAIISGQVAFFKALLDKGANPNQLVLIDKESQLSLNALGLAVMRGEKQCVDLLISRPDFRANQCFPRIGNLLHVAVYFHQSDMLQHLLTRHRDKIQMLIDGTDEQVRTPLTLAAFVGEIEAISYLHNAGASLECLDSNNRRPMHHAALGCKREAIQLLASLGSKIDPPDATFRKHLRPFDLAINLVDQNAEAESCVSLLSNLAQNQAMRRKEPSLIPPDPENLVFRGGGPKGLAYGGVLAALEQRKILSKVHRVAGTSAGAITATLLAVGYSAEELRTLLITTDFTTFLDHPFSLENYSRIFNEMFGGITRTLTTLLNPAKLLNELLTGLIGCTGVCEGEIFLKWIENLIAKKVATITGQTEQQCEWLTFGELKRYIDQGKNFKHLHVFGTRVDQPEIVHISSEDSHWDNYIISHAVRISMSIPGVFKPHMLHIKEQGQSHPMPRLGSFVDGGLLYNFPLETFDHRKFQTREQLSEVDGCFPQFNRRTLGFSLYSSLDPIPGNAGEIRTVADLLMGVCAAYMGAEELTRQLNPYNASRVVKIDVKDVGTLSFNLSNDQKERLVASGEAATNAFFDKHTPIDPVQVPPSFEKFVGRETLLNTLRTLCLNVGWKGKTNLCVLHGPGGIGKSKLAVTFSKRNCDAFSHIWTIPCESEEIYYQAYRTLAAEGLKIPLGNETPEEIITKVHDALNNAPSEKPWLLLLDNMKKPRSWPERGGSVVITCQDPTLYDQKHFVEVPSFNQEEALELFREINGPSEANPAFEEITRALEHSPQLLTVAAHYIQETHCSFAEWLHLIRTTHHPLQQPLEDNRSPVLLSQVFTLALNKLAEKQPLSRAGLDLCAYLNPNQIPVPLIDLWLQQGGHSSTLVERGEVIQVLSRRSFADYNEKNQSLLIHRNLQKVLRQIHRRAGKEVDCFLNVVQFLKKRIGLFEPDKQDTWPIAAICLPHVVALKEDPLWEQVPLLDRSLICTQVGDILSVLSLHREALNYYTHALAFATKLYGEEHPLVATGWDNLGDCHSNLGHDQEALERFAKAFTLRRNLLGEGDSRVLKSLSKLIRWLSDRKRYEERSEYLEQAVKLYKKLFVEKAPPPPPTVVLAKKLNSLGRWLYVLRQPEEALQYFNSALELRKRLLGEGHPAVAISLNNRGNCFSALGRYQDALEDYRQAVKTECSVVNSNELCLAKYVDNLVGRLSAGTNDQSALEVKVEILSILTSKLGAEHPLVQQVMQTEIRTCNIM